MTSDRKKRGVAVWATMVVVVGLVVYPLRFGPACWWLSEPMTTTFLGMKVRSAPAIYSPIGRLARWLGTGRIVDSINWYATLAVPKGEGVACGIRDRHLDGMLFWTP